MKIDEIKQGLSSMWDSVADGWEHVRQVATSSLTRFKPGADTDLPNTSTVDDALYMPSMGWSMLGGDLYEDNKRLVVRLELPGMNKDDINISIESDTLVVRGDKRFSREDSDGRYRVLQCAYGSFRRAISLKVPVLADQAKASYENGVLRVELPKQHSAEPKTHSVKVE